MAANFLEPGLVEQKQRHLVFLAWRKGVVKLCSVQLSKSGVFVHFPFHPDVPGILAVGRPDQNALVRVKTFPGGTATVLHDVHLEREGAVTSHKVKFSHHLDGGCHFSQDGKIFTSMRSKVRPLLDGTLGHLFSLDVEGLHHFAEYTEDDFGRAKYGQAPLVYLRDEPPDGAHIAAYWLRLPSGTKPVGELRNHIQFNGPDDEDLIGWGMAPPAGSPLGGYLLVLTWEPMERISTGSQPEFLLLFTGAFAEDSNDVMSPGTFLALQYPFRSSSTDLPSVDMPVRPTKEVS
jgi:hypothetical protein